VIEKHANGYVAYAVGLKDGVVRQGDTPAEALGEADLAKAVWLEAAWPERVPIPELR
jgi:predicted RNase H-like HicB family nuclease